MAVIVVADVVTIMGRAGNDGDREEGNNVVVVVVVSIICGGTVCKGDQYVRWI